MFGLNRIANVLVFCAAVLVSGCKEVLYSDLDEVEANQMVAVLQAADLAADRDKNADGLYMVSVEKAQIGVAVLLLQEEGLPRQKFASLGDIFADTGIVGTPFEERARFMHAINQEMSSTISTVDGVREARVHVVLPEAARFDREGKVASAAVVIYYNEVFDAQTIVPTIKTMMAHSVPELDYDDVAVSLFPVGGAQLQIAPVKGFIGVAEASTPQSGSMTLERSKSVGSSAILTIALLIAIAIIVIASLGLAWKRNGKNDGVDFLRHSQPSGKSS